MQIRTAYSVARMPDPLNAFPVAAFTENRCEEGSARFMRTIAPLYLIQILITASSRRQQAGMRIGRPPTERSPRTHDNVGSRPCRAVKFMRRFAFLKKVDRSEIHPMFFADGDQSMRPCRVSFHSRGEVL